MTLAERSRERLLLGETLAAGEEGGGTVRVHLISSAVSITATTTWADVSSAVLASSIVPVTVGANGVVSPDSGTVTMPSATGTVGSCVVTYGSADGATQLARFGWDGADMSLNGGALPQAIDGVSSLAWPAGGLG